MLERIHNRIHNFLFHSGTLRQQVFSATLVIGIFVSVLALVLTVHQKLGTHAWVGTLICSAWFIVFQLINVRRRVGDTACTVFVCGLNLVILPILFFPFGSYRGCIPLFYLIGLLNSALLLRGRMRAMVSVISMYVMLFSFTAANSNPSFNYDLSQETLYQNQKLALFLTGTAVVILTAYILKAYEDERRHSEELMERLKSLSFRDPLTSLYNRRELFRRLELVYQPQSERTDRGDKLRLEGCYIAMFDIDNFKKLNDTYGHQFGDTVLSTVAKTLLQAVDPPSAELAARYGGEEFVCMLYADSISSAFTRVDEARRAIAALTWDDVPGLTVTISGGLVSCEKFTKLDDAMQAVDKLLYQSKNSGKNRISTHLDSRR